MSTIYISPAEKPGQTLSFSFTEPILPNKQFTIYKDHKEEFLARWEPLIGCFFLQKSDEKLEQVFAVNEVRIQKEGQTYQVLSSFSRPCIPPHQSEISLSPPSNRKKTAQDDNKKNIKSTMNGKIIAINKKIGDKVRRNETIIIIEAMKMENSITSEIDAYIGELYVTTEQIVTPGSPLIKLTTETN